MGNFAILWIIIPTIILLVGFLIARSFLRKKYSSYEEFEIAVRARANKKMVRRIERAENKRKKKLDEYCLRRLDQKW